MDNFIHPFSIIHYSTSLPTPTPQEVIGLTPDSIWSWLIHSLGWHEPALSEPVKRMIRKRFESVPFDLRRLLIRPDLIPHRHCPPDSFIPDSQSVAAFYRLTAAIRRLAVRDIHRLFRDPTRNRVDRYDKAHHLWLPSAELDWLRMRQGMRKAAEGKLIDFPIAIRFAVQKPQHDRIPNEQPGGQNRTMTLHQRAGDGFWPIEFYSGSRIDHDIGRASISFNRKQSALGIELPTSLGRIGYSWIENATWGPKNRVLFKKVCSDEQIGILLWPSFPDHPRPTPRIPVYYGDIIELVHGDQLMIFVGPKRGLQDVLVQISVSAQWASSQDPERTYADVKYVYPNPCERYPYCVRRPIYQPVIALDPIDLEEAIRPKSEYNDRQADANQIPSISRSKKNPGARPSATPLETEAENEISSSYTSRTDSAVDGMSSKEEKETEDHLPFVEITVEVLDRPPESNEDSGTQDKPSDSRINQSERLSEVTGLKRSSSLNHERASSVHPTSSVTTKRKRSDLGELVPSDPPSEYLKRTRRTSAVHPDNNLDGSRARSQTSDISHTESIRRTEMT